VTIYAHLSPVGGDPPAAPVRVSSEEMRARRDAALEAVRAALAERAERAGAALPRLSDEEVAEAQEQWHRTHPSDTWGT
jgi:nucleoid-associated protein YgaU